MCSPTLPRNAIYYLRAMPHVGEHSLLVEACGALGFDVQQESAFSLVKYEGRIVASIVGVNLIPEPLVCEHLAAFGSVITKTQGEAFDRALSKLERIEIAVHEAGHAIVAARHGVVFDPMTLAAEELVFSNPIDDPELDWPEDKVRQRQQIYAAGAAAEQIIFQRERGHAATCDKCCHAKLENLLGQSRSSGFEEDIEAATKLLDTSSIESVASQLKADEIIEFETVAKLIGSKLPWE